MIEQTPEFVEKVTALAKQAMWFAKPPAYGKSCDDALRYTSPEYLETLKGDVATGLKRYLYSFERSGLTEKLLPDVCGAFPEYDPLPSGHFYYPRGGFMSWHTNSDKPEKRVYITYADEDSESFFRYLDNGEVITDWDSKGVNVRVFDATNEEPLFWHCVFSNCNRVSFGFRLMPR